MGTQRDPIIPPSWTIADWYVDPANLSGVASDANSGTAATGAPGSGIGPLLTVSELVDHRWGTTAPILGQTTTIHLLSTETVGQESIVLAPITSGGFNFVIIGTLIAHGAAFNAGVVTAKAPGNPGVLLQVAGFTHGETAGMLVHNVDNDSYAFIDSVTGPGVATMTQPFAGAGLTTITSDPPATPLAEDNAWDAGDSLQVYALPILNLKVLTPKGGDTNPNLAFATPAVWIQNVHIPDVAGAIGSSEFAPRADACGLIMSNCIIDPYLDCNSEDVGASGEYFINCWIPGGGQLSGSYELANCGIIGGALNTSTVGQVTCSGHVIVAGDCIVHGNTVPGKPNVSIYAGPNYFQAYFDAKVIAAPRYGGTFVIADNFGLGPGAGHPALWGPGTLSTEAPNVGIFNETGDTWTNCLQLAHLSLDGGVVGSAYAGGLWTNNVALTTANLDIYRSLQNPRSGSIYTDGTSDATNVATNRLQVVGAAGPANPAVFTTAGFSCVGRNRIVHISVQMSALTAAGGNVDLATLTILLDGGAIVGSPAFPVGLPGPGVAGPYPENATIEWDVIFPDFAPHTISAHLASGAASNVTMQQVAIELQEKP